VLREVHETAGDLYAAGFIDRRRMREFDELCLEPPPKYDGRAIRALRDRHQVSQAVLSTLLNTSLSTVRQWEIGEKRPSGPSAKLLNLLDRKGLQALL
jgi:putative transcriptional regulator